MVPQKKHKLIADITGIFLLVIFAVLIFQIARIQLFSHDKYVKMANAQHLKRIELTARRGPILDRNGKILADSIRVSSVCADPSIMKDEDATAQKLANLLNLDASRVSKLLKRKKNNKNREIRFVWIKRKITDIETIGIKRLNIKGVSTEYEYNRIYPYQELVSHIIGITDVDGNGLEGTEYKFNDVLKGNHGYLIVERDNRQRYITNINSKRKEPGDGMGIMLTIDSEIQRYVEEEIDAVYHERKAESVTAIVMDTSTGEILAMANRPTFNPNNFTNRSKGSMKNRAIMDSYEPGSVIKPIIVGTLFSNNVASPDDEIFCHNGLFRMGRRTFHDVHSYGNLTVSDIVVKSSNIGMAKLCMQLGKEKLYDCLESMKFGTKLGIHLPGEVNGKLRPLSSWTSYSIPSLAIGHEITVTPLQFITAFCSIANGGYLLRPTIIAAFTENDGKNILEKIKTPQIIKRVMSHTVARNMLNPILVRVVNEGTGKRAKMDEYQIAGKTGTAQKLDKHGYSHSKFIGSFIGYAPADHPRVCALVMVNEPKNKYYGGIVAAPAVRNILKKTLDYQNAKKVKI